MRKVYIYIYISYSDIYEICSCFIRVSSFSLSITLKLRIFSYVFVARNGRYPITNVARFTIYFTNVRMCVTNISVLKSKNIISFD